MVPWPIALLSLYFVAIATYTAATVWRIDESTALLLTKVAWCGLAGSAAIGLALRRPWGRWAAIVTATLLTAFLLILAMLLVLLLGVPGRGTVVVIVLSVASALNVLVVRYLQRPVVKAWFVSEQKKMERGTHGADLLR